MLIKLENPVLLSKAIDLISELVTEVKISVSDSGMNITAMDPANVAMVGFRLPKMAFSQFETTGEILGVNLDNLKRVLKRCGAGSSLTLESQDSVLKVQIIGNIRRNFSLGLIEVDAEDIDFNSKVANMEFSSRVGIKSSDLIDSVEDCAVVSDACVFIIKEGKFIIEARGIDSARSEFSGDEAELSGEESRAKYSLEYLQKFVKGSKLCDKTILEFANDHPLKLDIRNEGMEISFILAPRTETED